MKLGVTTAQIARLLDIPPCQIEKLTADGILQLTAGADPGADEEVRYVISANIRRYSAYLKGLPRTKAEWEAKS